MSDYETPLEAEERREREQLTKDEKFAADLAAMPDWEFQRYLGKVNAAAERQPPKPYDGGEGSNKRPGRESTQLYRLDADGNSTDEPASNSDFYDYLKSVGVSDSRNVEMTLSEHMARERKRRQGGANG